MSDHNAAISLLMFSQIGVYIAIIGLIVRLRKIEKGNESSKYE